MGIKFHNINCKILLFNELYPPTFEKDKKNGTVWKIYSPTFESPDQKWEHRENKFNPLQS